MSLDSPPRLTGIRPEGDTFRQLYSNVSNESFCAFWPRLHAKSALVLLQATTESRSSGYEGPIHVHMPSERGQYIYRNQKECTTLQWFWYITRANSPFKHCELKQRQAWNVADHNTTDHLDATISATKGKMRYYWYTVYIYISKGACTHASSIFRNCICCNAWYLIMSLKLYTYTCATYNPICYWFTSYAVHSYRRRRYIFFRPI